jgi:hypothetical protein
MGRAGESPIPETPPLQTRLSRYPVEDLAEAFAEGIMTGRLSTSRFQTDPARVNDLNAIRG